MRTSSLGLALAIGLAMAPAAMAQEKLLHENWSFNGPFGSYDRASAQRGFQIYKEVCSSCHSMNLLSYRDLTSLGLSPEDVKSIAAEFTVPGGINDKGEPFERPGIPSDRFKMPFANEQQARSANGGALPPDQSLIIKARENGPDYVYSLLLGYEEPPAGTKVPDGQYYNLYFPGHYLAMPQPLRADQVTYADGTKATLQQEAKDVTMFLTWASEPSMETRKQMGVKMVAFFALMTGLTYGVLVTSFDTLLILWLTRFGIRLITRIVGHSLDRQNTHDAPESVSPGLLL